MLYISSGSLCGRSVRTCRDNFAGYRPLTSTIRSAVFSTLRIKYSSFNNWLDLYAGTFITCFEALSNGFNYAIGIEKRRKLVLAARNNSDRLQLDDRFTAICAYVDTFIKNRNVKSTPFQIVFIDPPFDYILDIGKYRTLLLDNNWIDTYSTIIFHSRGAVNSSSRKYGSGYITYIYQ